MGHGQVTFVQNLFHDNESVAEKGEHGANLRDTAKNTARQ